jgi:ADP-ribose pyrophosphatase
MAKRPPQKKRTSRRVTATGKFVRLMQEGRWEYAERANATAVVVILAVGPQGLILTDQFRAPVGKRVIDLPAGLAGDIAGQESESLATAARRELLEEVGYRAARMKKLAVCPTSPGLTSETFTLFRAHGLSKVSDGGGDESEEIKVHEVPLDAIDTWLRRKASRGILIDPKVYAWLYFLQSEK